MKLREPLGFLCALGSLCWPVGLWALGGWDSDLGSTVVGVGSFLVLVCMGAEYALRHRDSRRTAKTSQ